jgi:methionyl-tRNA formyltransferase
MLACSGAFGRAVADVMATTHELLAICCRPGDKPEAVALVHGVDVVRDVRSTTVPRGTDLIVCAHSHAFVSRAARNATTHGAIGYHPSLLPLHRGRDAVRWTIAMRDRVAGGSVYWLSDTVDGGDVAARGLCFVRPDDTASTLWRRDLFPLGVRLLAEVVADVERGVIVRERQDESLATWEPSWEREPLYRPEVPQLTALVGTGPTVVTRAR